MKMKYRKFETSLLANSVYSKGMSQVFKLSKKYCFLAELFSIQRYILQSALSFLSRFLIHAPRSLSLPDVLGVFPHKTRILTTVVYSMQCRAHVPILAAFKICTMCRLLHSTMRLFNTISLSIQYSFTRRDDGISFPNPLCFLHNSLHV